MSRFKVSTLFKFLYFYLTRQEIDIKDGTAKLTFNYHFSGTTATQCSVHGLTLYEQDVELTQKGWKIVIAIKITVGIFNDHPQKNYFLAYAAHLVKMVLVSN